jgi:DNA-directed RNA polymerase subunit M/transcription elongation factor TFIIS
MSRLKLRLKIAVQTTEPILPIEPIEDLWGPQIQPQIDRVIKHLSSTQLKKEYVVPLEKAIRYKAQKDYIALKKDNFETYKLIYMYYARHIIANLREDNSIQNSGLITRINSGALSVSQLTELTPQEMYPERWQTYIEKKLLDIINLTKEPEATSTRYQCARCHRNKCSYYESQDRSADEPMTVHITCCYCGKKWCD